MVSLRKDVASLRRLVIIAAAILVINIVLPSMAQSADVRVVGGKVQRISGSVITLAEGSYDIGSIRPKRASGEEIPLTSISRERKVDIFIVNGRVNAVIAYPADSLE